MLRKLTGHFLAGLLAILPFVITIGLVGFVYAKLVAWLGPQSAFGQFVNSLAQVASIPPVVTYVATFAGVVLGIAAIGASVARITGRRIRDFFNQLISRIPFINKIYGSAEQVVQLFNQQGGDAATALSNVVMAKIANTYTLGMLSNSEPILIDGKPFVFFYMPNSPVPATGNLYLIPSEDIYDVDLSVEEMTRIEVSLGSLGPGIVNARAQPEMKASVGETPPL
jgi:uncharacterized membrane protein